MQALVCGGHGFIGHHMARRLKEEGYWVRTVDVKEFPYGDLKSDVDDYVIADLRDINVCERVIRPPEGVGEAFDEVYQFSAWMGGAQVVFSGENDAQIMHDSALLNINIAEVCSKVKPGKIFYSSSACVYNQLNQKVTKDPITVESSAYPAYPDSPYGWEKIFAEIMWESYARNHGLDVKIARFHNIFGECFDDKTEILTEKGFKYFKDISFRDKFATRNPETGVVEYQHALAIQNFSYKGKMYKIDTSDIDMFITPDHSVYVSTRTTKTKKGVMKLVKTPFQLKKVKDVIHSRVEFRSDFNWKGSVSVKSFKIPEVKMKDGRRVQSGKGLEKSVPIEIFLKFLGWYLSEGSCFKTPSNYTVAITQSKNKKNIEDIMSCIKKMGFSCKYDGKSVIVSSKQLWNYCKQFGHSKDKFIPREFLSLKKEKLDNLLNSLMLGDGDERFFTENSFRYSTVSPLLASDVQELLLKMGYQAWVGEETRKGYSAPNGVCYDKECSIYRVHACKDTIHTLKRSHFSAVDYCGDVYDVTVPNHIIFVRRNGKCVWSGNCGAWGNGREKSPAAMCRKVAEVPVDGTIEVWGDGHQTRSFLYIDECLKGVRKLMVSDFSGPVNIGSDEMVSINQLVGMVKEIANKPDIKIKHIEGPLGVRGRNSDNNLIQEKLEWAPNYPLMEGLKNTYPWIKEQVDSGEEDYPWSN